MKYGIPSLMLLIVIVFFSCKKEEAEMDFGFSFTGAEKELSPIASSILEDTFRVVNGPRFSGAYPESTSETFELQFADGDTVRSILSSGFFEFELVNDESVELEKLIIQAEGVDVYFELYFFDGEFNRDIPDNNERLFFTVTGQSGLVSGTFTLLVKGVDINGNYSNTLRKEVRVEEPGCGDEFRGKTLLTSSIYDYRSLDTTIIGDQSINLDTIDCSHIDAVMGFGVWNSYSKEKLTWTFSANGQFTVSEHDQNGHIRLNGNIDDCVESKSTQDYEREYKGAWAFNSKQQKMILSFDNHWFEEFDLHSGINEGFIPITGRDVSVLNSGDRFILDFPNWFRYTTTME